MQFCPHRFCDLVALALCQTEIQIHINLLELSQHHISLVLLT